MSNANSSDKLKKKDLKKKQENPQTQEITGETNQTFFYAFIGEIVTVTCFMSDHAEGTVTITGYLLDLDEQFFYFGDDDQEVTTAATRPRNFIIELAKAENQYTEILENMEVPEDNKKN